MPNIWRAFIPGGIWFFTVNLLERHDNDLFVGETDWLWDTAREARQRYPFHIDVWVILPEHFYCVLTLPPNDSDFSLRWRLIKSGFPRALPKTGRRSMVPESAGR